MPDEPKKTPDITKLFCGMAKDSATHKVWKNKSSPHAGTPVYLNCFVKGDSEAPTHSVIDVYGSVMREDDVWWAQGFTTRKDRQQKAEDKLKEFKVWRKLQRMSYNREMRMAVSKRLKWEWSIAEEQESTEAPVDWPTEHTLDELRELTGPGSKTWKYWLGANDTMIRLELGEEM